MSSNITSTLGGRGLGGVAQRYAVDPLALRGELGSSTVPHRAINVPAIPGVDNDSPSVPNDMGTPAVNTVNSTDTAFEVTLPAATAATAQLLTLNTRYPAAWGIGPTTHTLETELFGLGTVAGNPLATFGQPTMGSTIGFVETAFEIVGMGNNDINIVVKRCIPDGLSDAGATLVGAILLIRLKKRTKVVAAA
ncbi:MAG: hypothetical protein K0U52_09405 [Gammaproteobacteria bacterium]|nr:hypothetical protein [Gammaproteobacteria bacterium]